MKPVPGERTIGPFIFGRFRSFKPRFSVTLNRYGFEVRMGDLGVYVIFRQ